MKKSVFAGLMSAVAASVIVSQVPIASASVMSVYSEKVLESPLL